MVIVRHRINTVAELNSVDSSLGVEIDVRSGPSGLYLAHDPFVEGESLTHWLSRFHHQLLIVNVKEDGLEPEVTSLLRTHSVKNYFFLDQAMPTLIKRGLAGIRDSAIRFSEYESIETVIKLANLSSWVWIDFFHSPKLDVGLIQVLKNLQLKVCLVSPELHGIERSEEIQVIKKRLGKAIASIDAVCTKNTESWKLA